MHMRNEKGQMVVFLAAGFAFFLILFSIILNSSVLTYQKVKMQNTLDLAVKTAAQLQRDHLNTINAYNRAILPHLIAYEANLANPLWLYPCGPPASCPLCSTCRKYDAGTRIFLGAMYKGFRDPYADSIINEIKNTNKKAYDAILQVLLNAYNLPGDIKAVIKKKYGNVPESKKLADIYNTEKFDFDGNGKMETIKDRFNLNDSMVGYPLFKPEVEIKYLPYFYYYYHSTCGLMGNKCTVWWIPLVMPATGRIFKDKGSHEPHFFTMLEYYPIHDLNLFNILKRKETDRKTGLTKEKIFSEKYSMAVASMARPIDGDINDIKDYKDAELVGVSDKEKFKLKDWKLDFYMH